eukprot:CAMPEP_0170644654 /NCGR_PEP_ID=MMETSP0224-20130122/42613_1 /TAXON_ID=285029 /ORGANISM="Togula jolla, Strain CCCM 725" /LENGTH=274 /DNA_ID=CAMNT_0010975721 /DNA_START=26 /DNA_END=850 /DNA_ORIENTATION=+
MRGRPWGRHRALHMRGRLQARPSLSRRSTRGVASDTASVASERSAVSSGFSTQSAPAAFPQSAQVRLNKACDPASRAIRGAESFGQSRSGSSGRSDRPGAVGTRKQRPPAASGKAKARPLEELRRSRIQNMQKLYGLSRAEPASSELRSPGSPASDGALATAPQAHMAPPVPEQCRAQEPCRAQGSQSPAVDRTLSELEARLGAGGVGDDPPAADWRAVDEWPLPSLPEDPLNLSRSMASSGGLIAWSKNLKPEELSPHATMVNLLRPPSGLNR